MSGFAGDPLLKGMQDVHIRNYVLDNVSVHGVLIKNLSSYANIIRLDGGYIHLIANTAGADPIGIYELDSQGQITATNTQIIGRCAGSTGIRLSVASNSYYDHNTIIDCEIPFAQFGGRHISFTSSILNGAAYQTPGAAMAIQNGSRSYYFPTIDGGSNVFAKGIEFTGSPQNLLSVNTSNIVSLAVSGGASNILRWKGAAVSGHSNGILVEGADRLMHEGFIS
jgi:hypothetical protein